MKLVRSFFSLLLAAGFLAIGHSQVTVTYPVQSQDVVACQAGSTLRVRIDFIDGAADNPSVTIDLPPGIEYQPGSLSTNGGNLTIAEGNLMNANQPQFVITPAAINAADFVDFSISRTGRCDAVSFSDGGGSFKDVVIVNTDAGQVVENNPTDNSYSLLAASLSIVYPRTSSQDTIINMIPASIERPLEVRQGGLGFIETFTHFVTVGPGLSNYVLKFNGTALTPSSTNADTLFYDVDLNAAPFAGNVGDGDNLFENGEALMVEECFDVLECSQGANTTRHHARWGCNGEICQSADPVNGTVAAVVSQPTLIDEQVSLTFPNCLDGAERGSYSARIVNTSTTASANLSFEIQTTGTNFGFLDGNNRAAVDTNSVMISIDGLDVSSNYSITDFEASENACGAAIMSAVGEARYENIVLQPGEILVISYDFVICCASNCTGDVDFGRPTVSYLFTDACGNNASDGGDRIIGSDFGFTDGGAFLFDGPIAVEDGMTTTFCATYPDFLVLPNRAGDNQLIFDLEIPPGFTFSPNSHMVTTGTGMVIPSTATVVGGDSLAIIMDHTDLDAAGVLTGGGRSLTSLEVCYDLTFLCGTNGAFTLPMTLFNYVSPSCAEPCRLELTCAAPPIRTICPGVCPEGGGTVDRAVTERINFGLEDTNGDRLFDTDTPADPNVVRRSRAIPCDTICTTAALGIITGTEGSSWSNGLYRQTNLFGVFTAIGADIEVFDNGVSVGTVTNVEPVNVTGNQTFDYDVSPAALNALNPSFPAGLVYDDDDSIAVRACYYFDPVLAANDFYLYRESFVFQPNFSSELNQIENELFLSNDNFNTLFSCGDFPNRMTLVSSGVDVVSRDAIGDGCDEILFELDLRVNRGGITPPNNFDYFPNEFRAVNIPDTLVYATREGATFSRAELTYGSTTLPLSPYLMDVDSIYFDLRSLFTDVGGPLRLAESQQNFTIRTYFLLDCGFDETATDNNLRGRVQYMDPICGVTYQRDLTPGFEVRKPGNLSFVQAPQIDQSFTENTCYDLSATNADVGPEFNLSFTWLRIESPSGNINITSVSENGGMNIPLNPAGIYELGDHANNSTEDIEICVRQSLCEVDSFLVIYGWNCSGYPTDLNDVENCNFDTLVYFIEPIDAQIQLQITDQPMPNDLIDLCTTETIEVLINSAGQSDLIDPIFEVELAPGTIVNSVEFEYPIGMNTEVLTPTVMGNTLRYDLSEHTRITGDSLPGTFTSLPTSDRQVLARVQIETDCDYQPGQSVWTFRATADNPCGEPAVGSGVQQQSNSPGINGATTYSAVPAASAPPSANGRIELSGCSMTTDLDVSISFTVVGGMTANRDTAEFIVPAGIDFTPGSLVCSSPNASNCPSYVNTVTDANGNNVIRFAYPPGIGTGDQVSYSFGIFNSGSSECFEDFDGIFRNVASLPPTMCGATFCPNDIRVTTGTDTLTFDVIQSELEIEPMDLIGCQDVNGDLTVTGNFQVGALPVSTDDDVTIQAYCADAAGEIAGSPVGMTTVNGPIDTTGSRPFSIDVPSGCDLNNGIILVASGSCACGTDTITVTTFGTSGLVDIADQNVTICQTRIVDLSSLSISILPAGSGATWSTNGDGSFAANADGSGPTTDLGTANFYLPGPNDRSRPSVTLTLNQAGGGMGCGAAASDEIIVNILNVNCGSFPWNGN